MSEYRIAHRYAKALVDLYQERKELDTGYRDMKAFHEVLTNNPALVNLFKSPIIHSFKKSGVMNAVFQSFLSQTTMDFFSVIIRKKREYFLYQIAQAFIEQYHDIMNIGTAEVKTAVALDAKTAEDIQKFIEQFTGKKIQVSTRVDESLIGGIVIRTGDTLYDASISGSLKKAKQELINSYISN